MLVPHTRGHVRYHCRVRARRLRPHYWSAFVTCSLRPFGAKLATVSPNNYSLFAGFVHLGAGLACGLTGLAAGYAIGLVGDSVSLFRPRNSTLTAQSVVCPRICTRAESVRGYGSHIDFCRSPRAVRVRSLRPACCSPHHPPQPYCSLNYEYKGGRSRRLLALADLFSYQLYY